MPNAKTKEVNSRERDKEYVIWKLLMKVYLQTKKKEESSYNTTFKFIGPSKLAIGEVRDLWELRKSAIFFVP